MCQLPWIKFKHDNCLQIAMCRSRPFLHAFCTQEEARLLYNFFYNHNYQRGTGNFGDKTLKLPGQHKTLYHQNYLPRKQLCILLKPPSHSIQLQLVTQLASQLYVVPPELPPSQLGTSLLYFYFYPLCYAAVLLNFTYYAQ